MKKLIVFAIAILGFTAVSFGQAAQTGNAKASATIVSTLKITPVTELKFGNIIAGGSAGTVSVSTAGTPGYGGGTTAYAVPGAISAASFLVEGSPDASYSISSISDITVTATAGGTMTVSTFVTNPTPTGKLASNGQQTLYVGATLSVNTATVQAPGLYKNDTGFAVTVNYN